MFDTHCPTCAKRVLIFPSQITSLANTEAGIVLSFTCWCGTDLVETGAGRAVVADREAVAA